MIVKARARQKVARETRERTRNGERFLLNLDLRGKGVTRFGRTE